MFDRTLSKELIAMADSYPVVTITGPRQSGKTTLTRVCFPNKPYVNLEAPDTWSYAHDDPRGFLAQYPDGAIIDEVQKLPDLLSYIQVIVDEKNQKGQFILTGSENLLLSDKISQSLAGRTAILNLWPLGLQELGDRIDKTSLDELLLTGFFPRIYQDNLQAIKHHRDYIYTYVERDLRSLLSVKDLSIFQKFLKLAAARVGQILNINSLSNEIGVSNHTIKQWLSVLEVSFIITLLPPYYQNVGKRVIKSPKLYFVDVGLACYLLDIKEISQVARDPLRGHLFENLVVMDLYKQVLNEGMSPSFYFYRDSSQKEVDLLYKSGSNFIPIEIKASKTFTPHFFNSIKYFNNVVQADFNKGFVIYSGDMEILNTDYQVLNYKNMGKALKQKA